MTKISDLSTPTVQPLAKARRGRQVLKWAAIVLGISFLAILAGLGWMITRMNFVPADLDTSSRLMSEQGVYAVSYVSRLEPVPVNQIHSWTIHVETPDGKPVEDAQIVVDGDMPQHGHGLPTRPEVTRSLGNGDYQVDGLKFHMPGWWIVQFEITSGGQTDRVTFNLLLK